jgi:hypothetical protein
MAIWTTTATNGFPTQILPDARRNSIGMCSTLMEHTQIYGRTGKSTTATITSTGGVE